MDEKKLEPCEVCGKEDELTYVKIVGLKKEYRAKLCAECTNKIINSIAEARKLALRKMDEELLGKMVDSSKDIVDLMNRRGGY